MSAAADDDATGETLAADGVSGPSTSGAASSSLEKDRIAGRYEVLALLGSGGMGTVYKVRDLELDELVAMKVLRRDLVNSAEALARFRREVKLARRVTHRNVARTFDLGEHAGERFLTMELVDGESLAVVLARRPVLPVAEIKSIVTGILDGLAAAHAAGVVHRDLKPDNVIVARDGRVAITDFGVARAVADDGARRTAAGATIGTPAYMAPEQVTGSLDIDARADIYAFGVMFFELLTGVLPFQRPTAMACAVARLTDPPPDPRTHRKQLPEGIASIVLDCMARDPAQRVPSVEALVERFRSIDMPDMAVPSLLPAPPRTAGATLAAAGAATPTHKTVAVVPFRSPGGDADAYLAESVSEDLTDILSTTEGLRVRPPGVVKKAAQGELDTRQLGRQLEVQTIVEGSLRRTPTGLRIAVRVLGVDDGFQIWAGRLDRPEAAIFEATDEIARSVAGALTVVAAKPAREAPTDPAALDLYLRARHEAHGFWAGATRAAIVLYEQALAISPESPLILAGYARARLRSWFHADDASFGTQAREAAERAYAAAPDLAEANLALGTWHLYSGDPTRAVQLLRRACELGPLVAEAHDALGRLLVEVGVTEEGLRRIDLAAAMEPRMAGLVLVEHARTLVLRGSPGDMEQAERLVAQAATSTDPGSVRFVAIAQARFALWRRDDAALLANQVDVATPPVAVLAMQTAYATAARTGTLDPEAAKFFTEIASDERAPRRRRSLFHQRGAELAGYLNDDAMALEQIELADASGLLDLPWLERCPLLTFLAGNPRYEQARRSVGERAAAVIAAWR